MYIRHADMVRQPGNAVIKQFLTNNRILFRAQFLAQLVQLGQEILLIKFHCRANRVLLLVDSKLGILRDVKGTRGRRQGYSLSMNSSSSSVKWIQA